jgi:hypothetical protein
VQIQVRDQVLGIWRSVISHSYRDGTWHWGGRSGANSISDAEQLLCILYPATNVPSFRFDRPDETLGDVQNALRGLGGDLDAPRVIVDLLLEYVERYTDADGSPTFASAGYLDSETDSESTEEQRQMEVVDSFSMSVTLMLAALGFIRVLRTTSRNPSLLRKIEKLDGLASARLTAAMIGLLRSFAVNIVDITSDAGQNLISMINLSDEPTRIVGERLSASLNDIRASLREELSIGSGQVADELDSAGRLFECGWSWGVVLDAPEVEYGRKIGGQRPGVAEERPYLYFTVVAMDGIEDLFSERTRILGLLDEDQQRLAQALQLRFDLTLAFWNRVALFGGSANWPLEDLPWRTSDGVESDYHSLLMASIVVQRFVRENPSDRELARVGRVLYELAQRGRITRRPVTEDIALRVHSPGMQLRLKGSEKLGDRQGWTVSSFSSLLLKRIITMIGLMKDTEDRDFMIDLGDRVWRHLRERRIDNSTTEDLWDRPAGAFEVLDTGLPTAPSWYHTERVIECLVNAAGVVRKPPRVSPSLTQLAAEYLAEAEHLFDQEKLNGTAEAGRSVRESFRMIEANLGRARVLAGQRPGTAVVLAQQVLSELETLALARLGPRGTG